MSTSHFSEKTEDFTIDRWGDFMLGNSSANFSSVDFWEWFASYPIDSSIRGGLAEFIVMKSLGLNQPRSFWGKWDLTFQGIGIEVKSASRITCKHYPEDALKENQRIYFDIGMRHHHVNGNNWTDLERSASIYVFCLLKSLPATNLLNWSFFVIRTDKLNQIFGVSKTVSLSRLLIATDMITYSQIKDSVSKILNGGIVMSELSFEEQERKEYMDELQRLIACYQIASRDDKNVVWAALNKYMPHIQRV